jgi:hypothetical protein
LICIDVAVLFDIKHMPEIGPIAPIQPIRIEGLKPIAPIKPLTLEAKGFLNREPGMIARLNPENEIHVQMAHHLDTESAIKGGLFNEKNQPDVLTPAEFTRWIHAGESPQNMWRQHDFIQNRAGETKGFINSYRMENERTNHSRLEKLGFVGPKSRGDEMELFTTEGTGHLQKGAVEQHVSERFRKGKTDFVVAWTDGSTTPDKRQALKAAGFKRAFRARYSPGEESKSTCYILTRETYARAALENMATGK